MRNLPITTRLALATLYIRYRTAREHTQNMRRTYGTDALATRTADIAEIATWNALQAAHENIGKGRLNTDPREFLRMIQIKGNRLVKTATVLSA